VSGQLEFGEEDPVAGLRRAWELSLHLLSTKVPTVTFETYIRPIQPLAYQGVTVTLGVGNAFARDWIEKKALNPLRSALEFHLDVSGLQIQLVVLTHDQQNGSSKRADHSKSASTAGQVELFFDDTGDLDDIPNLSAPRSFNPLPIAPAMTAPEPPAPTPKKSKTFSKSVRATTDRPDDTPKTDMPSLPLNDRFVF